MSGAAKVNSKLPSVDMKPYVMPTTMHVNLKAHPSMSASDVGKKIHFTGHGIVRSVRKDQHEHRMEIDVKKVHGKKQDVEDME